MSLEQPPRRIRPGTRYKDFYNYPKNTYEEHREQVLGVSQWIEQNAREFAITDPERTICPTGIHEPTDDDIALWKYEQVRYFCKELNWLVVELQGHCPPLKYPQMIATEQWIFLCAAHKTPKECPAIDYMRHTLDFVAMQLNDTKRFPSRTTVKDQSVQKLGNICRRIYRLFAHAYYQHRSIYDAFEARTKLCTRFTMFARHYEMMPDSNIIVPCEGAPEKAREIEEEELRARKEKRENHNKQVAQAQQAAQAAAARLGGEKTTEDGDENDANGNNEESEKSEKNEESDVNRDSSSSPPPPAYAPGETAPDDATAELSKSEEDVTVRDVDTAKS